MLLQTQNIQDRLAIVDKLVEVAKADTLYSDLYLLRARLHLQHEMPREALRTLKQEQIILANLPNQIRNAMAQEDWSRVRELSGQYQTLKGELAQKQAAKELAEVVYERHEVFIDPFSPGMHTIAGVPLERLDELREATLNRLKELSSSDREWQRFYERRIEEFPPVLAKPVIDRNDPHPAAGLLEEEAASALEAGNFERLAQLAENLMQGSPRPADTIPPATPEESDVAATDDFHFTFAPETLQRARELGFGAYRAPSRRKEFAPLCRLAWHPSYAQTETNHSGVAQVPDLPLPDGVPEPMKARIQLFAMHPFINSAGVRFLPTMAGEDALVEDFPEPEKGSAAPMSQLLELLKLPQRSQLNRLQIEAAIQESGHDLLQNEFGLDPVEFKLVCVPPDLHLRIGLERGWGQQQIWTHFDGYMVMADGKLQALAGGDIRFGGIYDLLGVPLRYTSEQLIVRFAVIQRKRMSA
jgi:hypothetical protein